VLNTTFTLFDMILFTIALGGGIAAVCFRSRLPLDWEFATYRVGYIPSIQPMRFR